MAELQLSGGLIAYLDDEDLHLTEGKSWFARRAGGQTYAISKEARGGRTTVTYLHRLICDAGRDRIGFRNGNGLDCRRANLKVTGQSSAPKRSHERGSFGEAHVIADLARHGHDVFVPIAGHTPADLISVKGAGRPIRWQVKLRSMTKGSKSLSVSLSGIHPRKGGYERKPYDLAAIDGFAVVCPDPIGVYYIPVSDIEEGRTSFSVCLGPNSHGQGVRDGLKYLSPDIQ